MRRKKKPEDFVQKAELLDSKTSLDEFIQQHLSYPEQAKRNETEGTVSVSFSVNEEGLVSNARVVRGIGDGCDEEALRLVRLLRFKRYKNRKLRVQTNMKLGIRFAIKRSAVQQQLTYTYTPSTPQTKEVSTETPQKPDAQKPTTYGYSVKIG